MTATLIIIAHPDRQSLNHVMADRARTVLIEGGHDVVVRDLYAERFAPALAPEQFSPRLDPGRFLPMDEQAHAAGLGTVDPETASMQEAVRSADNLILQFPLWWWSLPAILKGWIDRVMSNGFAYGTADLAGRRAMLSVTAETKAARFTEASNPLEHIERGMLKFCGFEVLPSFVLAEVHSHPDRGIAVRIGDYERHLRTHMVVPTMSRARVS